LDAATVQRVRQGDCPEEALLLQYADLSLSDEKRAELQEHLQRCPSCACLTAELQRISAPIVRLHHKGLAALAWLHLLQRGRLRPKLEEAWALHRRQCVHC